MGFENLVQYGNSVSLLENGFTRTRVLEQGRLKKSVRFFLGLQASLITLNIEQLQGTHISRGGVILSVNS